jgi:hypothetical protein
MKIHVICCNDAVEYAVVEDLEKAEAKLKELKQAYFERHKWSFSSDKAVYETQCYWHINTVDGE